MSNQDLVQRNDTALAALHNLLNSIDSDCYQHLDTAVQGSIGTHVRHCIEFYEALLDDHDSGVVCYHNRPRRLDLEHNKDQALQRLVNLRRRLSDLSEQTTSLRVAHFGGSSSNSSTLRELSYVLDHTVHHTALIRVIASTLGLDVDTTFGFAASTLASRQSAG